MSADRQPHAVRFGLLSDLCYALGEQQKCTSMLVHPRHGEAVLWVPYPARPRQRLGVAAVDYRGRWLYTFGGQWSLAGNVGETAAWIAWAVSAR
jgi:hypothetical protein